MDSCAKAVVAIGRIRHSTKVAPLILLVRLFSLLVRRAPVVSGAAKLGPTRPERYWPLVLLVVDRPDRRFAGRVYLTDRLCLTARRIPTRPATRTTR